jgi:peptidoglycan L-alanyl-D-glutamate endopeptidase CwlK
MKFLYPDIRARIFRIREDVYKATGRYIRITQGLRSFEQQAAIYAQGRTAPGSIVTRCKPGMSWHNYGLAFDVCFLGDDPYLEKDKKAAQTWSIFGKHAEAAGMTWGGHFVTFIDKPHAQRTYGISIQEAIELYSVNGISSVWTACDKIRGVDPEWVLT